MKPSDREKFIQQILELEAKRSIQEQRDRLDRSLTVDKIREAAQHAAARGMAAQQAGQLQAWKQQLGVNETEDFNKIFVRWGLPTISSVHLATAEQILKNLQAMSKRMEELYEIAANKIITE